MLENSQAEDIFINPAGMVIEHHGDRRTTSRTSLSEQQKKDWLIEQLSLCGQTWDARQPYVNFTNPNGYRIHATFPPVSSEILISARRLRPPRSVLDWGEEWRREQLGRWVARGDTVLLSGATGSGKTTLLNELVTQIDPGERILALEDVPELRPHHPHFLSLTSRRANADGYGEVALRTLLFEALRMRPDRIILGECRGDEVLELLQILNTGHAGAMATIHANSPRDALRRLELLCLLALGGKIERIALRELIATGIRWVCQVRNRKIHAIIGLEGLEGDTILARPVIKGSRHE